VVLPDDVVEVFDVPEFTIGRQNFSFTELENASG
jgi:hypothetical protein